MLIHVTVCDCHAELKGYYYLLLLLLLLWSFFMDVAMGQIPRFTERISSLV